MPGYLGSIENSQSNRFTLSFNDSVLESAFLNEYRENSLRVILTYIPWIALAFVIGSVFPFTLLRYFSLGCLGFLLLGYLYFRLFPPGDHVMQLILTATGISLGCFYAYGLIALQGSAIQWFVILLIMLHTVSTSLAIPIRFSYSVVTVTLIWFGFGFVAFVLSDLSTVKAIVQFISLGSLNFICLFVVYQQESSTRANFYQRRVIEEREEKVTELSEFLKKMFGRYFSPEVMNSLIENPLAIELGGERRSVTITMTDLRGFTALSERLEPEQVVQMLNVYFEVMVEVVLKYNGTINEIIGDALLIIFGAPQEMPDRAQRAVACAIEMQNAMADVNKRNSAQGLSELSMGIGLNEAEVIVGNIGSAKRIKYGVVGSGVNMTSRIESYTVGGQILISESVMKTVGDQLRIDSQQEVLTKGAEHPINIYEVGGISGLYNLVLREKETAMETLTQEIPVHYSVIGGKTVGDRRIDGHVIRLSKFCAEIVTNESLELLTNLKLNLDDVEGDLCAKDSYGKVTGIETMKKVVSL
jgi:class 3 adenylate cyclase